MPCAIDRRQCLALLTAAALTHTTLRWGGSSAAELIPWIQALGTVKPAALGSLVVYLPVVAGLSYIQAKRDVA